MKACVVVLIFLFFGAVAAVDNGLALTPPMGWSTWCTNQEGLIPCLDDFCNEDEIHNMADTMVENGMVDLGYNYILLDDCWGGQRDAQGNYQPDASRFPSGMKALADYLHSKNIKLGVYTDVGNKTCKGGRPGSWGHYDQDAQTFASWGIDMVKMDWCDHPGEFNASELYGMMSKALNKTGRPILFSICEWGLYNVWEWAPNVANMWRISGDHLPLWWTPETSQDPGVGQGTSNIIQHMAGLSKYAGPGGWNDMDFLEPGYFWMSDTDQRAEFSFWCLFNAPLFVATDIRELSNKEEILNKEAIAVNQDPLGIPGDIRVNKTDGGQVWSKVLSNNQWAVILHNTNLFFETTDVELKFNAQQLPGWPSGVTKASLRDLWLHKDLGTFSDHFTARNLEAHGVVFLKVTPSS